MVDFLTKLKELRLNPKKYTFWIAVVISIATYLVFFHPLLTKNFSFWGSDVPIQYYPPRVYLYETIFKEHRFPFWTEKSYSGFPIYSDMQNAYLSIPNILSIILLGPMWSYKLLHFLSYLGGSLSLYLLLKRKGYGLLSFFVANIVYYFSFFHLNHQIHFNIILITYLLPLHILLADIFLEKRKIVYVVLQSLALAHGIYLGNPQFTLLIAIAIFLYILILSVKRIPLKVVSFYIIFVGILSVIETLPLSIPAYQLYIESRRAGDISYLEGSFPPNLSVVAVYPYLLGKWEDYKDPTNENFTYTETYIYVGIAALVLGIGALVFLPKTRFINSLYSYVWVFILLAFIQYAPIRSFGNLPLLELFRYWGRSIFIATFGVGILAGIFVESFPKIKLKDISIGLALIGSICIYLFVSYFLNRYDSNLNSLNSQVSINKESSDFITWLKILTVSLFGILLLVSLPIIFTKTTKKKTLNNINIQTIKLIMNLLLCGLVFYDLKYFSNDVIQARLLDISELSFPETPAALVNKRVIYLEPEITGNGNLYLHSWSLFGYSQFLNKGYYNLLSINNVTCNVTKCSELKNKPENPPKMSLLKNIGVYGTVNDDSSVKVSGLNNLDLIQGSFSGDYIKKQEGDIEITMNNTLNESIEVNTFLRSDKDWYLFIDGKSTKLNKDNIFMSFILPSGNHTVHFKFIPYTLFKGIGLSIVLSYLGYLFYKLKKINLDTLLEENSARF